MTRISAVDKFLKQRDLPTLTFFNKAIAAYYFIFMVLTFTLDRFIFELPQNEISSTQLWIAQGRIIPFLCILFVLNHTIFRKHSENLKTTFRVFLFIGGFFYLKACIFFVLKLSDAIQKFDYLFVWNVFEIITNSYLILITLLIIRMKPVNKKQWILFDIAMFGITIFAFVCGVLGQVLPQFELLIPVAVLFGSIAIALKFGKMTCQYAAA